MIQFHCSTNKFQSQSIVCVCVCVCAPKCIQLIIKLREREEGHPTSRMKIAAQNLLITLRSASNHANTLRERKRERERERDRQRQRERQTNKQANTKACLRESDTHTHTHNQSIHQMERESRGTQHRA
jgi:hypothetical protein